MRAYVYPGSRDPEGEAKIVERWPFGLSLAWPLCQKPTKFSKISRAHIFHTFAHYVCVNQSYVCIVNVP